VLLVDVHELDVVLADSVRLGTLEHEIDYVRRVLGFQSQNVIILSCAEDLGQGDQVDAEREGTVTAVWGEPFSLHDHRHKSNVGIVHGLQGNPGVIAVEIAVLHEVLDSIDDLRRREMLVSKFANVAGSRRGYIPV
jgi:hypothetical protein